MSNQVFGRAYADLYDIFYHDKDYEAECDLLEKAFRRYGNGPIKSVLDLGCGTGSHAILLAQRGYEVVGVDRSAEMVVHAQRKAQTLQPSAAQRLPVFQQGDLRIVKLGRQFDAVLMMFAVLGYQLTNEDVLAALLTVRRHLCPVGLFVADVWYGPAVLTNRPGDRVKVIPTADGKVIRAASGTLDISGHTTSVHYQTWTINGQRVITEAEETHQMRFFFPQELALFLDQVNMELLDLRAFDDLERVPGDDTWNVLLIGKASQENRL